MGLERFIVSSFAGRGASAFDRLKLENYGISLDVNLSSTFQRVIRTEFTPDARNNHRRPKTPSFILNYTKRISQVPKLFKLMDKFE